MRQWIADQLQSAANPIQLIAKANVRAGEVDEALKWLDEAIAVRDTQIVYTPIVPGFEPLWDHPRFRSILGKLAGTSPGCCWRGARARRLRSND